MAAAPNPSTASADHTDDGVYWTDFTVYWESVFDDPNDTYVESFPIDARQHVANAFSQLDDSNVPGSYLDIVQSYYSTYDNFVADFDTKPGSWGGAPGWTERFYDQYGRIDYVIAWLNSDWNWCYHYLDYQSQRGDMETVMVHEIGHGMGFTHPCTSVYSNGCDTTTIMAEVTIGTERTLTSHDKTAMAAKY